MVVDVGAGSGILSLFAAQVFLTIWSVSTFDSIFAITFPVICRLMPKFLIFFPVRLVQSMFMLLKLLKWQNMLANLLLGTPH